MNKYRVYGKWPFSVTIKADRSYIHQDGSLNFLEVATRYVDGERVEDIQGSTSFAAGHWRYFRKIS